MRPAASNFTRAACVIGTVYGPRTPPVRCEGRAKVGANAGNTDIPTNTAMAPYKTQKTLSITHTWRHGGARSEKEGQGMEDGGKVVTRPEMVRPLKTREVGEYMGLSDRQVLRMVRNGQLPAKRVGNQYYFDPRKIARICGMEE